MKIQDSDLPASVASTSANCDVPTRSTVVGKVEHTSMLWSDVSLISVAIIWGINIPVMKIGLEQIDIYAFNAIRLAVSAIVLGAFAWVERRRGLVNHPSVGWRQILPYAFVVSGLYQVAFLSGVSRTTSGNTALIIATVPMWTALLARVFIGERLRPLAWIGLWIAFVGTALVAWQTGNIAMRRDHMVGNLTILLSAMLWAGGTVYSRPLLDKISPVQLAAYASAIAWPLHLVVARWQPSNQSHSLHSWELWAIILYSGVLSSGLAQPMWNYSVRRAGVSHAAIIQNLVPLVAIIAAWLTRGEEVTTAQLVGGSLILGGLFTMRITRSD